MRPSGATRIAQTLGELALDGLKARTQELGMLFHVLLDRLDGGKEAYVAQLVELVGADKAGLQALGELRDNRGARTDKADAGAREGNLGRRGKGHHAVLGARRASEVKDVGELVGLVVQVVHAVGVVPEDAEIGRGRGHLDQAAHSVLAKGDARGVGILGHAPDTFDGVVGGNQALDLVHVGAVVGHRDGDILDTQVGSDAKVAVVAGNRAQELDLLAVMRGLISLPRLAAARAAAPEHAGDIVLDQQARRTQYERLLGGATQELPRQLACRGNALKATVVGAVDVAVVQIGIGIEDIEHGSRDVHLGGRRLAAGHVERQALGLDLGDLGFECLDGGIEFGGFHLLVDRLHGCDLSRSGTLQFV